MFPPSSSTLQQLYHLDKSSPGFDDQLCNVLYGEEYVQRLPNFGAGDLGWFIDYLDDVSRPVALPCSPLKRVGSRWSQSFRRRFQEVSTRTQEDLRR